MVSVSPIEVGAVDGGDVDRGSGRRRIGDRLPDWMGSIRMRIAFVYSVVLFGLAALVVSVIYLGLAHSLSEQPITRRVSGVGVTRQGIPFTFESQQVDQYLFIEREANTRALDTLRRYTFGSLFALFGTSVAVGWIVAGRVLRPMGHITDVAREIQATDLSRRINLGGPNDELRQLADTFDGMLTRLDDAFEGQRQFIQEASHELRNPLAVIRTNLDVALADPNTPAEELRHTAEVVQRSTERMVHLVDDLLVYARRGMLGRERAPVDISVLVREVAEEFRETAHTEGVEIVAETESDLWADADQPALHQALANLLANAIVASPAGSVIEARAGRHDPWVWMSVEDEGHGIAVEDQDKVFQRFWRGDPARGRDHAHSGLGLTVVRQVAEAHCGEVRVVSKPGEGAAFAIWIPAGAGPTGDHTIEDR